MYGFPAVDGPLGGIKLASERYESSVDPDCVDRIVPELATTTFFNDYIKDRMPHLSLPCIRHTTCLYTVTPNSDFAIGRLPHLPQCLAISACSGHGFKHSAAVGEAAAQFIAKGSSILALDAFPIPPTVSCIVP
jgi:sarcosine oxidase